MSLLGKWKSCQRVVVRDVLVVQRGQVRRQRDRNLFPERHNDSSFEPYAKAAVRAIVARNTTKIGISLSRNVVGMLPSSPNDTLKRGCVFWPNTILLL